MSAVGASADMKSQALRARAISSGWMQRAGRLGWLAKGVVYVLIGVLAVPIALQGGGGSGQQASRSGAIATIAAGPFGTILLVLMAIGLALYALWRLTTATLPGDNSEADTWAHRAGYLGSAALYSGLAWLAVTFVTAGGGGGSGDSSPLERASSSLMGSTAGRWLLGLGALVGLGVAAYFAYRAYERRFLQEIDLAGASRTERTLIERLGVIGWVGRAITVALLSVFVLQAAISADPDQANGLDRALRETADTWWGAVLVLVAGLSLIAYGVFAGLSARHRRLLGP